MALYMTDKKRVALTIFVEENFWRAAKQKFGRSKDQSFQRVGEALFRAWGEKGMPLDHLSDVSIPPVEDPVIAEALSVLAKPPTESSDPLRRMMAEQAVLFRRMVEMTMQVGDSKSQKCG